MCVFKILFCLTFSVLFQCEYSHLQSWKNFLIYLDGYLHSGSSLHTSHSFYNTFHLPVLLWCIMGACLPTTLPFSYFSSYWIFPSANQFLISEVSSDAFFFFNDWNTLFHIVFHLISRVSSVPSMTDFLL